MPSSRASPPPDERLRRETNGMFGGSDHQQMMAGTDPRREERDVSNEDRLCQPLARRSRHTTRGAELEPSGERASHEECDGSKRTQGKPAPGPKAFTWPLWSIKWKSRNIPCSPRVVIRSTARRSKPGPAHESDDTSHRSYEYFQMKPGQSRLAGSECCQR